MAPPVALRLTCTKLPGDAGRLSGARSDNACALVLPMGVVARDGLSKRIQSAS